MKVESVNDDGTVTVRSGGQSDGMKPNARRLVDALARGEELPRTLTRDEIRDLVETASELGLAARAQLRAALISIGTTVGAGVGEMTSDAFLCGLADEARLVVSHLRRDAEAAQEVAEREREFAKRAEAERDDLRMRLFRDRAELVDTRAERARLYRIALRAVREEVRRGK